MARSVILLQGDARYESGLATGALAPGMLVNYDPSSDRGFIPHGDAGEVAAAMFVDAYGAHYDGKGINTLHTSGNDCTVIFPVKGAKVNAVTTETLARGDYVESAGDGTVQALTSTGYCVGQCAADSDLSATIGRVHIIII